MRLPWVVIRDLDQDDRGTCLPELRSRLLGGTGPSDGMCFRLAVRSIEAWLMADHEGFVDHFGPQQPPARRCGRHPRPQANTDGSLQVLTQTGYPRGRSPQEGKRPKARTGVRRHRGRLLSERVEPGSSPSPLPQPRPGTARHGAPSRLALSRGAPMPGPDFHALRCENLDGGRPELHQSLASSSFLRLRLALCSVRTRSRSDLKRSGSFAASARWRMRSIRSTADR